MSRVALCSAKGSPGVTTLSCVMGAVWPAERVVVVAECDPSGGDLAGRFGLSSRLGMTSLILTERQGMVEFPDHAAHTQCLPGGMDVLVAPSGADSAMALDHELGMSSSGIVSGDCDLLADCGRLLPGAIGQERVIRDSDHTLLLVRADVNGIAHARWAASRIGELDPGAVSVVIIGASEFTSEEVAEALGLDVFGVVPFDPRAAEMACGASGKTREFVRSVLVAFARQLVTAIMDSGSIATTHGQRRERRPRRLAGVGNRHHDLSRTGSVRRTSTPPRLRRDEGSRDTST
jgi:hypothetical protein